MSCSEYSLTRSLRQWRSARNVDCLRINVADCDAVDLAGSHVGPQTEARLRIVQIASRSCNGSVRDVVRFTEVFMHATLSTKNNRKFVAATTC